MSTVKYTKAIRAGRLKATEMAIGETVSGVLKDFKEGKDFGKGPTLNPVLEIQGKDVEIFPAGNLKFIGDDVAKGKRNLGDYLVITRAEDRTSKNGFTGSAFTITNTEANAAINVAAPAASTTSVAEKLAAIRAAKGTSGANA